MNIASTLIVYNYYIYMEILATFLVGNLPSVKLNYRVNNTNHLILVSPTHTVQYIKL